MEVLSTSPPRALLARLPFHNTCGFAAHSSHVIMTATYMYKGASSEQAQSKRAQPYDSQHNQSHSRLTSQSQRARINKTGLSELPSTGCS